MLTIFWTSANVAYKISKNRKPYSGSIPQEYLDRR